MKNKEYILERKIEYLEEEISKIWDAIWEIRSGGSKELENKIRGYNERKRLRKRIR